MQLCCLSGKSILTHDPLKTDQILTHHMEQQCSRWLKAAVSAQSCRLCGGSYCLCAPDVSATKLLGTVQTQLRKYPKAILALQPKLLGCISLWPMETGFQKSTCPSQWRLTANRQAPQAADVGCHSPFLCLKQRVEQEARVLLWRGQPGITAVHRQKALLPLCILPFRDTFHHPITLPL